MPDPSRFAQVLGADSFIVTCELDPPKGFAPSLVDRKIAVLKNKVQAVVVSDNPRARMQMAPIGFCRYLLEQGIEPIMTMTCRDRNRLALQSDLLAAAGLGLQNILAVTGDYITWGDHPEGKPVYDLDSIQLIWAIAQLNSNKDISGNDVEGPPPFFAIGSSVTLTGNPVGPLVLKFRKKEGVGIHFFMSHPVFDLTEVEEFFKQVSEIKTPLLASVCLLTEEQIRGYVLGNYPGLLIPESLSDKFKSVPSTEFQPRMMEYTAHLIEAIKKDGRFRGVHLMLQGEEEKIVELI
jgi:methylenetetrahydrofolate reductase (NADPH)